MAGLLMMNDDAINAHDANEAEKAKLNELITIQQQAKHQILLH